MCRGREGDERKGHHVLARRQEGSPQHPSGEKWETGWDWTLPMFMHLTVSRGDHR